MSNAFHNTDLFYETIIDISLAVMGRSSTYCAVSYCCAECICRITGTATVDKRTDKEFIDLFMQTNVTVSDRTEPATLISLHM